MRCVAYLAAFLLPGLACSQPDSTLSSSISSISGVFQTGSATGDSSGGGQSSSEGSSRGSTTSGTSDTGVSPPPDLPDFDTQGLMGCQKIDLLFVVSDGGDLKLPSGKAYSIDSAKRVSASTAEFIALMQAQQVEYDLQVMVVKGDPTWSGDSFAQCCNPSGTCDLGKQVYPFCEYNSMPDLDACDSSLGAGVVFPAGFLASNERCLFSGGRRFIGEGDDLGALFNCAIDVGRTGGKQVLPEALLAAVGPKLTGEGGCNAGFLRPDAMLVVTLLAERFGETTPGLGEAWAEELIEAKDGDANAVVLVGLMTTVAAQGEPDCYDDDDDDLRRMVESVPSHVLGSICAPNLGEYLSSAISVIDAACANYVPPAG